MKAIHLKGSGNNGLPKSNGDIPHESSHRASMEPKRWGDV